ncbi:reverse transcriptase zinc-binding domain-containing protein [Artemisia annua]|uniref:Reverse transcriptase zinc-binding domain-containing protein n=1 Tax=Artemisia annua TaxID=35608 RepID=A0A2U1KSJ6_ARTAN|nr:reverse transcriptase zinc-binding domain-containing protein [Artemisia annua]
MSVCALCMKDDETHDHLFFYCQLSSAIWNSLKTLMNKQMVDCKWNETINNFAEKPCNNSIWSIVRRLCLAAAVYGIWRERNSRIFSDERCTHETVFGKICDQVRSRLISLKAKSSSAISQVEHVWNIKIRRINN